MTGAPGPGLEKCAVENVRRTNYYAMREESVNHARARNSGYPPRMTFRKLARRQRPVFDHKEHFRSHKEELETYEENLETPKEN